MNLFDRLYKAADLWNTYSASRPTVDEHMFNLTLAVLNLNDRLKTLESTDEKA